MAAEGGSVRHRAADGAPRALNRSAAGPCPVCGDARTHTFLELGSMPVLIGEQWPDGESARACDTGDILLAYCRSCGFVWNVAFDPRRLDYRHGYDNSLHFSAVFQQYTRSVVERLVSTYDLRGKRVVDIGCGKGDFLAMLCEAGENYGFGFDPSFDGARVDTAAASRISWLREPYGERHAALDADLVASRYVFEHIPSPLPFLRMIRRGIAERAVVYFEVPNVDLILRQHSVWDVIYEHCSYFGIESLTRVFQRAGFRVLDAAESYARQFVSVEARVEPGAGADRREWGDPGALEAAVLDFDTAMRRKTEHWRWQLAAWRSDGTRAVAWGAGAKAVGFLNMLGVGAEIPTVVDINPCKRHRHLPGTGQRIVAPGDLRADPPDVVVLMNPVYRDEVARELHALGLSPALVDV